MDAQYCLLSLVKMLVTIVLSERRTIVAICISVTVDSCVYKTSMVRKLRLNFVELAALVYGVKHFPENTPKRWSLVSQLVRSSCSKYSGTVNAVSMEVGFGNIPAVEFQGTEEHCKEAYQSIQTLSPEIFECATIQSRDEIRPFSLVIIL